MSYLFRFLGLPGHSFYLYRIEKIPAFNEVVPPFEGFNFVQPAL